ncbi:MAG: SRPBCC family protein [Gemmatimonadota bacterium]|nr:MAG: SRPBCC family protein [Gemmatimonadota bacterium]
MALSIEKAERGYLLEARIWLPRPVEEVFEFFCDAGNLETITPPFLRFEILTPLPLTMRAGTLIDYRLRLRGIPVRWRTEITAWEPPTRFVDEQRRGPYRWWIHEHRFGERAGGTEMVDRVRYGVPGGPLVNGLFVARDLRRIFEYRGREIERTYAAAR